MISRPICANESMITGYDLTGFCGIMKGFCTKVKSWNFSLKLYIGPSWVLLTTAIYITNHNTGQSTSNIQQKVYEVLILKDNGRIITREKYRKRDWFIKYKNCIKILPNNHSIIL